MNFRKVLFWTHLGAGLVAGTAIAIMCFTGTVLAFEKQLVAWSERDAREVSSGSSQPRLTMDELSARVRETQPESRPTTILLSSNPREPVTFTFGRDANVFVNPYTGEVRTPHSTRVRAFMQTMTEWHRYLAFAGEQRTTGKVINGVCNIAFFVLAVTGLYLWMPRQWSWPAIRAVGLFNGRLKGKGRDFNWHNVIGLWSAPILIVLTLTAIPMSFRWGTALVFRIVGEEPPVQLGAGPGNAPIELPSPVDRAKPINREAQFLAVQAAIPNWDQITLRLASPGRPSPASGERNRSRPASTENPSTATRGDAPAGERAARTREAMTRSNNVQPVTFVVKTTGAWPRTATTTVSLNPFTGDILRHEAFSDQTPGRRLRGWTRFLHTGEALGGWGQLVAGLASLGGCFLVYTGVALAWRRFFGKNSIEPQI